LSDSAYINSLLLQDLLLMTNKGQSIVLKDTWPLTLKW